MSAVRYPNLFRPLSLGTVTLPNRVVMAPMSTQLGSLEGEVTPEQIAFYRHRAEGGVGMIIVEFCCVQRSTGRSEHRQLGLETRADLEGHVRLVQSIQQAGAVACLQLQHGGSGVPRALVEGGVAVGPSEVRSRRNPEKLTARALTDSEIEVLIECFGKSAELGIEAGYQVVELHGAHGYLLTQFLSPLTNHRDDRWGGDETRRLHFIERVIGRVKLAIGERPLSFRLSADEFSEQGLGIDDMVRIAPKLVAAGVDLLHVSIGLGYTGMENVIEPMSVPEGWRLPYARRIREAAGVPVITVGQIRRPQVAETALAEGDADLIALGRPLLADAQWANKAKAGLDADIRPCTSCNYCVASHAGPEGIISCAENPRTGHELDPLPSAGASKGQRAVVIGAGPGGMAAALMLDQAGYRTELYEARQQLGGGLIASAAPPHKDKLNGYLEYLRHRLQQSDVILSLGQSVELSELAGPVPQIVILATGTQHKPLGIEGEEGANVRDAYDLLMGDIKTLPAPGALPIVVYGGGETGCETAEYLAERGYQVVLVSRSPVSSLARSAEMIYREVLLRRLQANPRVTILDQSTITRIDPTSVLVQSEGQSEVVACSQVLLAQGRRPDDRLVNALIDAHIPFATIGDASKGGRIGDAVHAAYRAVCALNAQVLPLQQLCC